MIREHVRQFVQRLLLPLRHLHRMHAVLARDLVERVLPLESLQHHLRLELPTVLLALRHRSSSPLRRSDFNLSGCPKNGGHLKRYKGNIGPDVVRDFRGAMVGRADKGVLISTGGFTLEARREATRDGAPPIDLIDGRLLAEKLKELKLGVRTNLVEHVEIVEEWFRSI